MKALGLPLGKSSSKNINMLLPTTGTAVNGTIAQGTLTVDARPIAGDTITIGTKVYTFTADATAAAEGEVDVGADLDGAQVNIVAAINGTDGNNSPSAVSTAGAFADNDSILTATAQGAAGNAIPTTETFDDYTSGFDAVTLGTTTLGISGTSGRDGAQLIDDTYLYISIDESTLGVGNWRRIALGSTF